jgi:hypothetical protein
MGIARALGRVKRQAKRGGLGALRSGLGEELRSGSIPAPLRGAARRIAALIDPTRPSSHKPGSSATPVVERAHTESLRAAPPEHANKLGSDRGDAPITEPEQPASDVAVDPIAVGATPVYDATPTEVAPIDATPDEVALVDVTPVVVESEQVELSAVEEAAAPVEPSAPKKKSGNAGAKKKAGPAEAKEKLAPAGEEAKSAARSGTKAKRSGPQGGKASKKK